jgi:hypothetical protein
VSPRCTDWTSALSTVTGKTGRAETGYAWSEYANTPCNAAKALYCFQN